MRGTSTVTFPELSDEEKVANVRRALADQDTEERFARKLIAEGQERLTRVEQQREAMEKFAQKWRDMGYTV